MTTIPGVNNSKSSSGSTGKTSGSNGLADVDLDQFLGLLITELQNQDPLNPMDNAQMLQQISEIRQIGSTNKLTDTLSTLAIGQELSMASSLIGKEISALDTNSKDVKGIVDRVAVQTDAKDNNNRKVQVHIGDSIVDIKNIREIVDIGS
jgi:flagellar basal-body rod modification protein FlgD